MSETHHDADDAEHDHVDFLTFDLAGGTCAIEVGRVRGTMDVPPLTRVPGSSGLVEGVASVDGGVVVVVDARSVIRAGERAPTDPEPMLVLLETRGGEHAESVAVVVDRVGGIQPYHVDDVVPTGDASGSPPGGDTSPFRAALLSEADADDEPVYVLDVPWLADVAAVE